MLQRVLALYLPELPLQRALRARERIQMAAAVVFEGRVIHCTAPARAAGVRPGHALVQARAACAGLEELPLDPAADRAALRGLAEAMFTLAPIVEVAPPDTLLLDASAAHLVPGHPGTAAEVRLAEGAMALALDLGYRCRVAVASGREPARALARHGTASLKRVLPGETAQALAALPIQALDLPPDVCERFCAVGVADVGALVRLPPETLAHRFGAVGAAAARLARGDDPRRLVPYVPETLPEEPWDFDGPVDSAEPLLFAAKRLAERVAARLAGRGLGATRLKLVLKLDPRGEERLLVSLARPTTSAASWLLVLRERLTGLRLPAAVTGLRLSPSEVAETPAEQLAFGDRPEAEAALEAVLSRLATRLGAGAAFAAESADRHRPEAAYQPVPFATPARNATPTATSSASLVDGSPPARDLVRPTRLLAPPRPIVAEGEGGRLTALRLAGKAYPVVTLVGPERLCGEWWSEPFDRDYYRVRLAGLGDVWVFRDGGDGRLYLHGLFD